MKTLTSTLDNLSLGLPNVALSRTSLAIKPGANAEDYSRLESWLETAGGSMLWWWGDYLNHLASARGVEYAEAKAGSSYSPVTLKHAAWVCRHVAVERRREALTFGHHAEVTALSPTDQEVWLYKAEFGTELEPGMWSVKQLRAAIRQSKAGVKNGPEQAPEDSRAARASASFESFSMWYQVAAAGFTSAQRAEWNQSLRPLVADYLVHATAEDVRALIEARAMLAA